MGSVLHPIITTSIIMIIIVMIMMMMMMMMMTMMLISFVHRETLFWPVHEIPYMGLYW